MVVDDGDGDGANDPDSTHVVIKVNIFLQGY